MEKGSCADQQTDGDEDGRGDDRMRRRPGEHEPRAGDERQRADAPIDGLFTAGWAERVQCPSGHHCREPDEGQQREEDPAPTERRRDRGADRGPDEAGKHPCARQHREHPGLQVAWIRTADRDVRDRRDRARADSLYRARDDEHDHAGCETTPEEPDREQHESDDERAGGTFAVGVVARGHHSDEAAEEERAEDPSEEADVVEVVFDDFEDGRDREPLEPDERDREDETDGERARSRGDQTLPEVVGGPISPAAPPSIGTSTSLQKGPRTA